MSDFSQYQQIGTLAGADYYLADPDIILVIPQTGYHDNVQLARQSADFLNEYVGKAEKKFATVIVMSNVLAQDAETRRIYQNLAGNGLYFGIGMVVDSALSRALASFFIGFSRPPIPTQLFNTVEKSIEWLRTIRPQ